MTMNQGIGIAISAVGLLLLGFVYLTIVPLFMVLGLLPKGGLLPKK